jgi:hypothetical protein
MDFLGLREGGMVFYRVFLLSSGECKVIGLYCTVEICKRLREFEEMCKRLE